MNDKRVWKKHKNLVKTTNSIHHSYLLCFRLVYKTEDPDLKEEYQKDCALDSSECCRDRRRRGAKKKEEVRKEPFANADAGGNINPKKDTSTIINKIPQGIQVCEIKLIYA